MGHTKLEFTMDPNLLVSVIKSQAGTLSKALLEGVMNSIDAGASRVDVTLDQKGFTISDNGRGFSSEEEIKEFFGRFGTPHKEGDALYGRFRMGRGQMMAFASTLWRSGRFEMAVDIEKDGLTYKLRELDEPVKGCVIVGLLYRELDPWKLRETLEELRRFVKFTPKPVYVNGELFGASPSRLTSWTYEDEYAYYRIMPGADTLQVYNLGVFVEDIASWRTGVGGIVVSKRALELNFPRNSVMAETCPVWAAIRRRLEQLFVGRLALPKALNDTERKFVATRIVDFARRYPSFDWWKLKLLTDPSGRHLSFQALRNFKRFVCIEDRPNLAAAVHGTGGTFVVTGTLLNRFGVGTLSEFLMKLEEIGMIDREQVEVLDMGDIAHMELGGTKLVDSDGLTRKERAAFAALQMLNAKIAERLAFVESAAKCRELRVGVHKNGSHIAWTDGREYITAHRKFLKRFHKGLDGVLDWLFTLVHEYMHDSDDSESHEHGEVFYRKFHDTVTSPELALATLAREGLAEYLAQLKAHGVPRPRSLMRQLRG